MLSVRTQTTAQAALRTAFGSLLQHTGTNPSADSVARCLTPRACAILFVARAGLLENENEEADTIANRDFDRTRDQCRRRSPWLLRGHGLGLGTRLTRCSVKPE